MANSCCPRCDTKSLSENGMCMHCGYVQRILCPNCGNNNKANAKFCGNCGNGMNLSIRLKQKINGRFSYIARLRIRHFATGLAFGTLLALFAFGALP